jgi:hypothetical protein
MSYRKCEVCEGQMPYWMNEHTPDMCVEWLLVEKEDLQDEVASLKKTIKMLNEGLKELYNDLPHSDKVAIIDNLWEAQK